MFVSEEEKTFLRKLILIKRKQMLKLQQTYRHISHQTYTYL